MFNLGFALFGALFFMIAFFASFGVVDKQQALVARLANGAISVLGFGLFMLMVSCATTPYPG